MFGLIKDVVDIATAPIKVAEGVTRVVTKPIADVAKEVAKEVESVSRDLRE